MEFREDPGKLLQLLWLLYNVTDLIYLIYINEERIAELLAWLKITLMLSKSSLIIMMNEELIILDQINNLKQLK